MNTACCLVTMANLGQTVPVELPPPVAAESSPLQSAAPVVTGTGSTTLPIDAAKEKDAAPTTPEVFTRPDYFDRHSLSFIMGSGAGRFNIIDWESSPNRDRLWRLAASQEENQIYLGLGFNIHWWAGPTAECSMPPPNLPAQVFDLYLDFAWSKRWTERLTTEVRVMPGLYTDFRVTPPDAFRTPGYAVGVFEVTPELRLVGGVDYLQRIDVQLLPVAGVLWQPTPEWEFRLVFPEPKIAFEVYPGTHYWLYVAGEYGGGRWSYKNELGHSQRVEYSDLRAAVGLEWRPELEYALRVNDRPVRSFIEAGYVFNRNLRFPDSVNNVEPQPAWMVRFGCTW